MIRLLSHRHAAFAATLCLGAFSLPLHAQQFPSEQLVRAGATMQAVAEYCGDYSAEKLSEMREQQRASIAPMGVSGEQFDQMFRTHYNEAKDQISAASETDKTAMCEKMRGVDQR